MIYLQGKENPTTEDLLRFIESIAEDGMDFPNRMIYSEEIRRLKQCVLFFRSRGGQFRG